MFCMHVPRHGIFIATTAPRLGLTLRLACVFGGHACANAERIIAENKPGMFPLFKCKVEPLDATVGPAEVYMRVSKQILQTTVEDAMISFACPFNTFGSTGEKCEDCPIGAFCAGGVSENDSGVGQMLQDCI